ncbi:HARE-HTH domain-containing protein [Chloropicon primus]|nr:HARE-HTH domain-containing protein [Chloropicon primus]
MRSLHIDWDDENLDKDELKEVDSYFSYQTDDNESDGTEYCVNSVDYTTMPLQVPESLSRKDLNLDLFCEPEGYRDWLTTAYDSPVSTLIDIDIHGESVADQRVSPYYTEYGMSFDGFGISYVPYGEAQGRLLVEGDFDGNCSSLRSEYSDSRRGGKAGREHDCTATSPVKGELKRTKSGNYICSRGSMSRKRERESKAEDLDYGSGGENSTFDMRKHTAKTNSRGDSHGSVVNTSILEQDRAKFKPHSIKASIFQVLEEAGPRGLQVAQIVEVTQERGMKDWRGVLTPKCTVSASCSTDPVFVRVAPGTFTLRALLDMSSIPVAKSTTLRKRKRTRTSYHQCYA